MFNERKGTIFIFIIFIILSLFQIILTDKTITATFRSGIKADHRLESRRIIASNQGGSSPRIKEDRRLESRRIIASNIGRIIVSNIGRIIASNIRRIIASNIGRIIASNIRRIIASNIRRIIASNIRWIIASNQDSTLQTLDGLPLAVSKS
jgi:hypothetical protein